MTWAPGREHSDWRWTGVCTGPAAMDPALPMVRGFVLAPMLALAKAMHAGLPVSAEPLREIIAALPKAWFDYAHFHQGPRAADQQLSKADFAYAAGYVTAKRHLSGEFRDSLTHFLGRGPGAVVEPWTYYFFGLGDLVLVKGSPCETEFRLDTRCDPLHARYITGWLTAALEMFGLRLTSPITHGECLVGDIVRQTFTCAWERDCVSHGGGTATDILVASSEAGPST